MAETDNTIRRLARNGVPLVTLAAVAIVAMLVLVVQADTYKASVKGYAELSVTRTTCFVDATRAFQAGRCFVVGPGVYQIVFQRSLRDTTPFVSRGSCCPGTAFATVTADNVVTVVTPGVRRATVRVSVLVP